MNFKKIISNKLNWLLLVLVAINIGWTIYMVEKFNTYISLTEDSGTLLENIFSVLYVISYIGILMILIIKLYNFSNWLIKVIKNRQK